MPAHPLVQRSHYDPRLRAVLRGLLAFVTRRVRPVAGKHAAALFTSTSPAATVVRLGLALMLGAVLAIAVLGGHA